MLLQTVPQIPAPLTQFSYLAPATHLSPSHPSRLKRFTSIAYIFHEHHKWLKKRDWPAVQGAIHDSGRDAHLLVDLLMRKYKERDEDGRLPHHWMAAKAQTHTHTLAYVGVYSIGFNLQALTTRDKEGESLC